MHFLIKEINIILYKTILKFIFFYQKIISPILPARCRYYPTCSNYGKQALAWHGVYKGTWLLIRRISHCHPLGGHGVDFVPLPLATYEYFFVSKMNTIDQSFLNRSVQSNIYRDSTGYVARLNDLMSAQE